MRAAVDLREEDLDPRDQPAREVTFSIIDSPAGSGELLNANSTGTLIDLDDQCAIGREDAYHRDAKVRHAGGFGDSQAAKQAHE